jgi:DNA-binding response OmpR family regulator
VKKILIIEDEPSIADNIIYALRTEGFEPCYAGTGSDALELLRSENIALSIRQARAGQTSELRFTLASIAHSCRPRQI